MPSIFHYLWYVKYLIALKKDPETIVVAKKMIELTSGDPYFLSQLGWAYGVLGNRQEAQRVLKQLDELSRRTAVPPPAIFYVYLGLGNLDATMEYMQKAYRERWSDVVWIKSAPEYDILRSDARFVALLSKMRFPE